MHSDPHLDALAFGTGRIARQHPFLNSDGSPKREFYWLILPSERVPDCAIPMT
jgi:hypothetical protein